MLHEKDPTQRRQPKLSPLPDGVVVCTRKHYKVVVKLENPVKKLTWTNDAKPETPNATSNYVLTDWIITPPN